MAERKNLEEIDFEGTDLEKKVTNSGTNELIVREFMKECIKDENGVLPGKSIVFAISHKHALRLEELRLELRNIMQYRSLPNSEMEQLDLEDMTLIKQNIEFGPELEQTSVTEYRKRLETKLKSLLSNNDVLQRLKKGEKIDDLDIENLAGILQSEDPYITLDNLRKVYDNKKANFIDFISHVLGLQKLQTRSEIIANSFDSFIKNHSDFSSDQIRFLQILKTFVIERGQATKENLASPPFTNLHHEGIMGIFKPQQITEILSFVEGINRDT